MTQKETQSVEESQLLNVGRKFVTGRGKSMEKASYASEPCGNGSPSQMRHVLSTFLRDRLALAGFIFIVIVILAAVSVDWIMPYSSTEADRDVGRYAPLGTPGHPLGTDGLARDILTRLLAGGRVSITVALVPTMAATGIGLAAGLMAAYTRSWIGGITMRVLDVMFAFPPVLLAIAVATILGPGMMNVMLAIGVVSIPYLTRVVYVEAVSVRGSDYLRAARVVGTPSVRMLRREVLPNVLAPLVVYASTGVGGMIVMAAGLSFLGVGIQPPTPDWGIMTADGRVVLQQLPHIATVPGLMIVAVALAFNFVGDGLRDALDPRHRTRTRSPS
jgi:peptide/nickel transport system permease protein